MAREMKDSGVAWLGVIPANWNFGRVKHYYTVQKSIVGESADEYERLALTLNGVIKRSKEDSTGLQPDAFNGYQVLRKGELVFKLIDLENVSTSRVGLSPYTGIVSPAYIVLKSNGTIDSKFGYYYFISLWQRKIFNHLGDDGVRSSLNANDLLNLPCLFPPPDEQNQIVDYLNSKCSEIDAVLKKTHVSIEEYKKLKQTIITQAVTKGVRGNRSMRDSRVIWLGDIPADWSISKIKHTIFPHEKPILPTDDVITCFRDGTVTLRKNRREEGFTVSFTENGYQGVDVGDLVIHGMDTFAGAIGCSDSRGKTSPVVHVCSTIGNNRYFMYFLRYMAYSNVLMDFSNGVRIRSSDFRNFKKLAVFEMLVPPLEEQNEIVNYLDSILAKIEQVIKQKELLLNELESYKKTVTYEYVTGKKEATPKQQIQEIVVHPFFPAVFQATNRRFAQAILMSKVLDSCKVKMGRVKLEKMMFVLENSIGFDFDTEYVREAAGPLDKSIYECEQIISRKNKWFTIRKSQYGVSYKPTSEHSKYKKYYAQYFSDYEDAIDNVISIFNDFDTDQAEVIATLYGAWNDCIIDKRSYTDNDIVDEVLNHWHPKKRRFPKDMWLRAIQRMRELDLVPHGYGRHTVIKQN